MCDHHRQFQQFQQWSVGYYFCLIRTQLFCFVFSERLVKKRKQSHTEYIEDLSKFGKKRKVDEVCN